MTTEQQEHIEPAQLPMAPGQIRTAVLAELESIAGLVAGLTSENWAKPSAAAGWTIGDVVAHLNLAMGLHSRLLDFVSAGKGGGAVMKRVGQIGKVVAPA